MLGCRAFSVTLCLLLAGCQADPDSRSAAERRVADEPATHPASRQTQSSDDRPREGTEAVAKSDEEWRKILTPEQFHVTRQKGTERPFTGKYWNFNEKGEYRCVCCGHVLFTSKTKFDAGCGWPSFYEPAEDSGVQEQTDLSHGMNRTEVVCGHCGAHLGHVFDDGPAPTGLRYCINSAALEFKDNK